MNPINNHKRSDNGLEREEGGKEERYRKILSLLEENPYLTVQKLSNLLYVSLPTVRRDLTYLEQGGLVVRSHGGVRRADAHTPDIPLEFRNSYKNREKRELCRVAARFVKPGQLLFIDASTTLLPLAEELACIPDVRVVTNSAVAAILFTKRGIAVCGTGGEIQPQSFAFCGADAEEFVRHFRFDIMFFSTYGVTRTGEIVDTSLPENYLRRAVLARAKEKIYVSDGEKFGLDAPYTLCALSDADIVVTNRHAAPEYEAYAEKWAFARGGITPVDVEKMSEKEERLAFCAKMGKALDK